VLKKLKKIIKNLLAIAWIRGVYNALNKYILSLFSSNRLFATVYTFFGFMTFNREQYAVLKARRNYYRNLKNKTRATHVELRRNIHRLEKGMTMQPRRPIFARDYVGETIGFYEDAITQEALSPGSIDSSELLWAHDVLEKYFSISSSGNAMVDDARARFEVLSEIEHSDSKQSKSPYKASDRTISSVEYDELLTLATQRRSIRWFKKKRVPRTLIDQALLVGRQSPTACNRLPYEFRIFDDPEMVKKVAGIPFGAGGYSHQVPAIAVVVGKLDSYFSPRDRHAIYIDSSLASMSFMLALETLGLSSTVINWPDFEPLEIKMQKTLGLETSERVVMLIAIGYADPNGGIPYSQKKNLETIRQYNKLSQ